MLLYQLRMAVRGLRRDRGLWLPALAGLALATSIWTTVVVIYQRVHGGRLWTSPAVHQVELPHRTPARRAAQGSEAFLTETPARTRVSYPEYRVLAGSGLPVRQTATFRAPVAVSDGRAAAEIWTARFVDADFFAMFGVPVGAGRAFSREEEASGAAVLVLADARETGSTARSMVGRTLLVDGRPFRVVGGVSADQPVRPDWDISAMGDRRDEIYLPLPWGRRLLARPDSVVPQNPGPRPASYDELLRSDALPLSFWIELPDDAARAAYRRHLDQRLATPYQLRSLAEWRRAFPFPETDIGFFAVLISFGLLGAGFNMTRLLLARALVRREELGIHRALGAPRAALLLGEMVTAALVSLVAAVVGLALALPYLAIYNHAVPRTNTPARFTATALLLSLAAPFLTGLLASLYPAWRASRTRPTVYLGLR